MLEPRYAPGPARAGQRIGARWPMMLLIVLFLPGHMGGWALEWAWLALFALVGSWQLLVLGPGQPRLRLLGERTWMRVGMLLTILTAVGAAYAALRFGILVGLRDLIDFPRYLIYGLMGILIARNVEHMDMDVLDRTIRALIAFNLVCSALILLHIPGLRDVLLIIYDEAKLQYEGGYVRIGIPFPNPNFAAMVFMFCLAYFTFFRRSVPYALLSLVAIVLTGSRSGLLASGPILLLGYFMMIASFVQRRQWKLGLFLLLSHGVVVVFYNTIAGALEGLNRLQEVVEALESGGIGNVNTARIRNEVTQALYQDFVLRSPWLGWGPGKSIGIDVSDSQYMSWVLLFGVPGAVIAAGWFCALFVPLLRHPVAWRYRLGTLALALSFALILYTGDFMKNYRMYFVVVYFLHIMLRQAVQGPARIGAAAITPRLS